MVTLSQFLPRIWGWKESKLREHGRARPTRPVRWLLLAAGLLIFGSIIAVFVFDKTDRGDSRWQWLDVVRLTIIVSCLVPKRRGPSKRALTIYDLQITTLSLIKVLLTIIKYVPQALLHIRSRSTLGFSITQVLLDTAGGVFSMLQLVLDSYGSGGGWEGMATSLADNPGKLGLAGVSLFFDAVFIVQHYVLYGPVGVAWREDGDDGDDEGERRALLG